MTHGATDNGGGYSIDGRSTEPQLNTPGGDSGEFIVALAVYERELKQVDPSAALTRDSVRDLLNEYLGNVNRVRRWYLHSDLVHARFFALRSLSSFFARGPSRLFDGCMP
jgi:hypothetical protein